MIDKKQRMTPTSNDSLKSALCKNISSNYQQKEQQTSASNNCLIYINLMKQLVTCGIDFSVTVDVFQ